jgi:hypothetical protein
MILRRLTTAFRKQDWFTVAVEIMIVVLGVFIGLQVNNWNAARSQASLEISYLQALKSDFAQVIDELEEDSANYLEIAGKMDFLLEQSRMDVPDASPEQLTEASAMLVRMEGTAIVRDMYTNLTSSGDISVIKSQEIKKKLAAFYAYADIIRLVSDTHEQQLVNIFQPYIRDNLDYVAMLRSDRLVPPADAFTPEDILDALKTREFRNVAAIKWDITTDIANLLDRGIIDAREMEALIDAELEMRE